jgi:hypothetical protein
MFGLSSVALRYGRINDHKIQVIGSSFHLKQSVTSRVDPILKVLVRIKLEFRVSEIYRTAERAFIEIIFPSYFAVFVVTLIALPSSDIRDVDYLACMLCTSPYNR